MKLVLFSTDEYFVKVFSDFLAKKRTDVELFCFTSESAAAEYLSQGKVSVLFSEEGYLQDYVGKLPYVSLGMTTVMPKEDGIGRLNIYQKASRLLEDFERILGVCMGETKEPGTDGKQIAVYSTQGGSGKTTIAYLMAVQGAKKRKTVYWNLELLTVTDNLYRQEFKNTMEQILYEWENDQDLQEILYDTVRQNADGVYVLPAVKSYGDYRAVDTSFVQDLCGCLSRFGMEQIVLDLPSGLNRFSDDLLVGCGHIVWVFDDTAVGRKKEERVRQDPSLKRMLQKSSFVRNSCKEESTGAGVTAAFPYSSTMGKADRISTVLEVNPAFVDGCRKLWNAINEGR